MLIFKRRINIISTRCSHFTYYLLILIILVVAYHRCFADIRCNDGRTIKYNEIKLKSTRIIIISDSGINSLKFYEVVPSSLPIDIRKAIAERLISNYKQANKLYTAGKHSRAIRYYKFIAKCKDYLSDDLVKKYFMNPKLKITKTRNKPIKKKEIEERKTYMQQEKLEQRKQEKLEQRKQEKLEQRKQKEQQTKQMRQNHLLSYKQCSTCKRKVSLIMRQGAACPYCNTFWLFSSKTKVALREQEKQRVRRRKQTLQNIVKNVNSQTEKIDPCVTQYLKNERKRQAQHAKDKRKQEKAWLRKQKKPQKNISISYKCSNCSLSVSSSAQKGHKCPKCGVRWKSKSEAKELSFVEWFFGMIGFVIVLALGKVFLGEYY